MADQSRVLKNVAFNLYFHVFKSDGTVIANPGGLAGRIVCAAHTAGAATDAAPSCVDTTGGACLVVLSQAEMNSDYVEVKATSTDTGAVPFTCTLYPTPVGMTGDAYAALALALKLLRNRVDTNPITGVKTVYDDDSTTPLFTASIFEDVAGTMPFDGSGANRVNRLA